MNIFVGNLSFDATEEGIREAFEDFGDVVKINLILDQETGKPKGYGFVIMDNGDEARDAIMALDGSAFMGRNINVNQAKPAGGGNNNRRGQQRQKQNRSSENQNRGSNQRNSPRNNSGRNGSAASKQQQSS